MPPNVVQKRSLGYREAIHQASTAHEFAPGLTFRKMDPATALCRRPTNFPIFFTSEYQTEPLPLHHEAILRRPFQTTSLAGAPLLHSGGMIANVVSFARGVGVANIARAARGVAHIVRAARGFGVANIARAARGVACRSSAASFRSLLKANRT